MNQTKHFDLVRHWAYERNLIAGSTPAAQFLKLSEEVGEIAEAMDSGNREGVIDGAGDVMVVLTIMAEQMGVAFESIPQALPNDSLLEIMGRLAANIARKSDNAALFNMGQLAAAIENLLPKSLPSVYECLVLAYDEIKDRKGKMINGVFVKQIDLGETVV